MLDRFAKEKYEVAANLLDEISGEDIRLLLLEVTMEASKKQFFEKNELLIEEYDTTTLKKLAESLLFRIVFDKGLSVDQKEAASLVCAYAYETLCPPVSEFIEEGIEDYGYLNRILSSLLYYLSGYDPNAKSITNQLEGYISNLEGIKDLEIIAIRQLYYFTKLSMDQVKVHVEQPVISNLKGFDTLNEYSRQACLYHLINCLNDLSEEFLYVHPKWNNDIKDQIKDLIVNSRDTGQDTITLIASLLLLFEELLKGRALSTLKKPAKCNPLVWKSHIERYIEEGMYFIWPPHRDAISKGLLEERTNNIIAIPTGTGKSLIAEHKVISNLQTGSIILYLAPTLALCRQIDRSMKKIMNIHKNGEGNSVVLDDINLLNDKVLEAEEDMILVMTPEKCVTLIANNPDIVTKCSLCIVDEFHTIFHGSRGALLDLLLSRISQLSETSFLIMSALIDKSQKLEDWLKKLSDYNIGITDTKWRPTRTLRGFVSHPEEDIIRAKKEAEENGKKQYKTKIKTNLYFCVQDIWSGNKRQAYPMELPIKLEVRFKKAADIFTGIERWIVDGYGNDISRQLGNYLSSCNMPVLIFSQGTRHLLSEIEKHSKIEVFPQKLSELTKAYLTLACEELGYKSELESGLKEGIGIHTQALIDEEQLAVEEFFRKTSRGVLCATGTISQGLNLAAAAVIVNTTKQYSEEESKSMSKAEVINMLGRAGRPGFGLQSLGIIVPQYPSTTTENHFELDSESTIYLERVDGVEDINSGLLNVINEITQKEIDDEGIDDDFTLITNVLGGSSTKLRKDMLKKTLATQFLEDKIFDEVVGKWNDWLIRDRTKEEELILKAAVKSTSKASVIEAIYKTIDHGEINRLFEDKPQDKVLIEWLFRCLYKLETPFIQENVHELFTSNTVMIDFIWGWIEGYSILDLAKILNKHKIGSLNESKLSRSNRTSIAKAIKIIKEGIRNISHITSAYVILVDLLVKKDRNDETELPKIFLALSNFLRLGVTSEKAVALRRLNFPRHICNELSEEIPEKDSIKKMMNMWKLRGRIDELKMTDELENALITILK
jgi:DEAD/DEAH box helicase/Helicase conserved C-terminal domain